MNRPSNHPSSELPRPLSHETARSSSLRSSRPRTWSISSKNFAVLLIALGLVFGSGYAIGSGNTLSAAALSPILGRSVSAPQDVDLDQFWKVWRTLDERFGGSATSTPTQEKVWGAIKGLTEAYDDPYTTFLTPEEMSLFETSITGSFSGVGMEIAHEDGMLTVIAPLKGSPAEKAGIKTGDIILKINDTDTNGLSVDDAVLLIRGAAGTSVSITYYRDGEDTSRTVSIIRQEIALPILDTKLLDNGIYYARLYTFTENSGDLFERMLADYTKRGQGKMILDLRGNPGGYLDAAVDMASHFLPEGDIIVTEDYRSDLKDDAHRSKGYGTFPEDDQLVILINAGSASASEILAGALREHGRATLIGQTSFGKGSVQELIPISKDTALKVTVARWLTPKGHSLSDHGIDPDIVVTYPDTARTSTSSSDAPPSSSGTVDLDLAKAIELLTTRR